MYVSRRLFFTIFLCSIDTATLLLSHYLTNARDSTVKLITINNTCKAAWYRSVNIQNTTPIQTNASSREQRFFHRCLSHAVRLVLLVQFISPCWSGLLRWPLWKGGRAAHTCVRSGLGDTGVCWRDLANMEGLTHHFNRQTAGTNKSHLFETNTATWPSFHSCNCIFARCLLV